MLELTTVADDEAVLFDGPEVVHYVGLEPDTDYEHEGVAFRTLPRPPGELLSTLATVNDLHFGETECGRIEGVDIGPVLSVGPGQQPYPEVMNEAAVDEILAVDPALVLAKGDLTADGRPEELQAFLDRYGQAFGERLRYVHGNHDAPRRVTFGAGAPFVVDLPGVRLAVLDTVVPGTAGGRVGHSQLEWLDQVGADADRPVLVFGHHHCWGPSADGPAVGHDGIDRETSIRLVEVVARRPRLIAYLAGHTHRNRVQRFAATGPVPFAEVAAVKDFPGSWAEYRVFEGGILQIHRRLSSPRALEWSERCRAMFAGLYPSYAFGALGERCFAIDTRWVATTA